MAKKCKPIIKKSGIGGSSDGFDVFAFSKMEAAAVLKRLKSNVKGLSDSEVRCRLNDFGENVLAREKKLAVVLEFLSKFKSPLIILLFVAAIISAYFGQVVNAAIIALMIVSSGVLDFFEEHNAGQAVKKLLETIKTTTTVIRGGEPREIKISQVAVGDIIFLNSGDLVPADCRVISAKDFFVNQSALTGESIPSEKFERPVEADHKTFAELENMIFAGTNIISGSANAVAVSTGRSTEFGKIAGSLARPQEKSEFEDGIVHFGYFIMKIILFLVMFIFLFNAIFRHQILESFLFSVAIAVGITPELLPMIMSITMSRGSLLMAKKGAIVKKLSAIPNFGSMDILCTDKTGTLTEGKISLVKYVDSSGNNSEKVLEYAYLNSFYQTGIENPLDKAVIEYKKIDIDGYKKIDEIPYDFARKRMSVVVEDGERLLITKGAPEEVFNCCATFSYNGETHPFGAEERDRANRYYEDLSREGYRVLALAVARIDREKKVFFKEDECNLEFRGFIAFLDPPKKGVKKILEGLEKVGITIKIITGDNELVTKKICEEINLPYRGVLLGEEIKNLSVEALRRRVETTTIFARFSPADKNRVILALRGNGHVVGYLGDGINDAPSLRTADVGISVNNAVDVAKESADIVLVHKSLQILRDGVIEGRKVFGNTMKYILMGLSSNFGNMFSAAGAVIFLPFLPMLPVQILLNNFIYDVSQLTIPTDNVDDEWVIKAKRWNIKFIRRFMLFIGPISSIFDFSTFFLFYFVFRVSEGGFQTAWFLESLMTQTLVIHFIRTKRLPFIQSRPSLPLVLSTFSAVIIGWIIPFTIVGRFFGLVPLPLYMLGAIIGTVIIYLGLVEIGKRIFYAYNEI
ncbi:MAG TPA: magnesium-translocating P-type ATPase [Candidatus Nanoarchaeia archaeon]|nr:magnesium-translocating P-type ATPase [Candidatus Nanoarchaeia archaeon]